MMEIKFIPIVQPNRQKDLENLKQGSLFKIFGQIKQVLTTTGKNIKMFVFCLLSSAKSKKQVRVKDKDKSHIRANKKL